MVLLTCKVSRRTIDGANNTQILIVLLVVQRTGLERILCKWLYTGCEAFLAMHTLKLLETFVQLDVIKNI